MPQKEMRCSFSITPPTASWGLSLSWWRNSVSAPDARVPGHVCLPESLVGTPSELGAPRPSSLQTGTHWDGRHPARPGSQALEGSFRSIFHPVCPGFVSPRLLCPPLLLCLGWRRRGEGGSLSPELGQCFGQRRVRWPLLTCSAQQEIARGCLCAGPMQRARLKPPLASSPTPSPFQASDALFLNLGTWSASRRPRLA